MNKSMVTGTVIGVLLATAGGVWASYEMLDNDKQTAATGQDCYDVVVDRTVTPKDKDRITGTVVGAVVGGVLGNEVGDGNGRKAATVAGAAGGAYAGNRIQENIQDNNQETLVERRCVDKN